MELIYCFLGIIDNEKLNLGFNFSEKFEVEYNVKTKKIKINKKKVKVPEDFYGKKISNLNILLGKNGSRKTTLLNLLGTTLHDQRKMFSMEDKWFIIYFNDKNEFIIEGTDLKYINQLEDMESLAREYYLTFDYCFEEDLMSNIEFIQENQNEFISSYLNYLYLPANSEKLTNFYQDNYGLGFRRVYLHTRSYLQEYLFLKNEFLKFQAHIQNLKYSLKLFFEEERMFENRSDINLNLYGDNILIFEKKIFNKNIKKVDYDLKECFIINFLEKQIINAWNNKDVRINNDGFLDKKTVRWTEEDLIVNNKLTEDSQWETYEERKIYLSKILNNLVEKLLEIYLPGEEETNYYFQAYTNFIKEVEKLDLMYFESNEEIIIDIIHSKSSDDSNIQKLLNLVDIHKNYGEDKKNDLINSLNIYPNELSDGQKTLVKQFARINTGIEMIKKSELIQNTVLLIDEPEMYLHPEWSRKYLNQLLEYINQAEIPGKIHLVLTTHSPFLLSDVLGDSVLKIDNRLEVLKVKRSNNGYAMNFYDLLKDSFFLDISIGEFAEKKINKIITNINNLSEIESNTNDGYEKIKKDISFIGDTIIKNELLIKLERTKNKKDKRVDEVEELREKVKQLEKEIKELKE